MAKKKNRYSQIIEEIFFKFYRDGDEQVPFQRTDIEHAASELGIDLPKNLGDVVYSFRYRTELPEHILKTAPEGYEWIIVSTGQSRYRFRLARGSRIVPNEMLVETKLPDATPGIIDKYTLSDEQALLAKLRYNRLIDVFTGLTCYSLQNHLRTTAPNVGQVEIDEIYIGLDKRGVHYVLPVEAKGGSDRIGVVQIEQDFAVCGAKFPNLICRLIAAQFMEDDLIALFEFERTREGIAVSAEKHYRLVQPEEVTTEELATYQQRPL